jgi:hypothetical protein
MFVHFSFIVPSIGGDDDTFPEKKGFEFRPRSVAVAAVRPLTERELLLYISCDERKKKKETC